MNKQAKKQMQNNNPILVIGAGSWGTALAIQLARAGNPVKLWGRDESQMQRLASERCNERYLPGSSFPDNLLVCKTWSEAMQDYAEAGYRSDSEVDGSVVVGGVISTDSRVDLSADSEVNADSNTSFSPRILVSVPSHAFRSVLDDIRQSMGSRAQTLELAWATKGFELDTGLLPHQVAMQVIPVCKKIAVLSGPTFALEVGAGLPTAITVAASDEQWAVNMANALRTKNFIAYTSSDMVGVEIGGAVKNALAIGAGLSDGLGFGANARIALINRGLRELSRLGLALGAQKETFVGLAGMGDLVLTCTDNQSRNRRMGLALASGKSIDEASAEIGQVVEGIGAARAVYEQAQKLDVHMPIIEQIYRVVVEGVSPHQAVEALLDREMSASAE